MCLKGNRMSESKINKTNLIVLIISPFAVVFTIAMLLFAFWGLGWIALSTFGVHTGVILTWLAGGLILLCLFILYQIFLLVILPFVEFMNEFIHEE